MSSHENKIDFVVIYVDMSDKEWCDGYNEFIKTNNIPLPEINNVEVRSRDYGTLKCLFRSLDLYAPWINNVFLCVQRESQVPKWINRDTVKVVLHEEFIPREFLPVYNTFTIQTHVHRIPGISENFIFSDDDSILMDHTTPDFFFNHGKMVQNVKIANMNMTKGSSSKFSHYFKCGASEVVKKLLEVKNDFYYEDDHAMHPMSKSLNEELYNKLDISKHVSAFREKNNIFRFTYLTYAWFKRKIIFSASRNGYIDFKNKDINQVRKWLDMSRKNKQISVNDQDLNPIFDKELFYKMVEETLQELFPNKSKKYEL